MFFHILQFIQTVTMQKYQLNDQLGVGSFGIVYCANYGKIKCAAKVFHKYIVNPIDEGFNAIAEMEQMKFINHKCLVKYYDVYCDGDKVVLIIELCGESLTNFLEKHSQQPLPYHVQLKISLCIAQALEHLHSNGIFHGNLSSNNVLMVAENKVKVSDYGLAKYIPTIKFSNDYMPPEVFCKPPILTEKVDIFSFGVLQVQMMTRQPPNPIASQPTTQDTCVPCRDLLEKERRSEHLDMIDNGHPMKKMILRCLHNEMGDRPTSPVIVQVLKDLKEEQRQTQVYEGSNPAPGAVTQQQQQQQLPPTVSTTNLKLILVGERAVGKSNIMKVYVGEWFGNYRTTISKCIEFQIKRLLCDSSPFRSRLW